MKYIARVELAYSFAQEHMAELGSFWALLQKKIPAKHHGEISVFRLTFATVVMEAENENSCREILMQAWSKLFPEQDGISEILVSSFEMENSELIETIYNNYYGANDYIRMITELYAAIPILREKKALDVLRSQNYLFAIDGGYGFSSLFISLGDFLHKMKLYEEEGEGIRDKYIEYVLGKETANGYVSPDDLIGNLYDEVGDENPINIVGIDVSYYLEGHKFDEMRQFLKRLSRYEQDYVFAFRIPFLEKKAFDEVKELFSDVMFLRTVQVPPLPDCVLMETFWNIVNDKNYTPDVSLMELVSRKISQEKMDGRFYGFQTIKKIAYELIMKKNADTIARHSAGETADESIILAEHVTSLLEGEKERATGCKALEELVGMEEITQKVQEIIAQVKVAISNEKLERPCIHMRFTGAPGTGKTTVARIIGQIMREEGILRKGGFFEYSGRDLVAEYVGQTSVKTATICRDSYGSVLFIDEAYALYDGDLKNSDYGKEALNTLIAEMENHRDDMLVVMAGYTDEMEELMKANPGLRSRMPRVLHFPNYSRDQLFEIFMLMVRKHFHYRPELEEEAKHYFAGLSQEYLDSKEFANARFVRNLYERTWSKAALRSSLAGLRTIELTREDFIAARSEKEFSEKIAQRKVLGF